VERTPGPWRIEDAPDAYGGLSISGDNGSEYSDNVIATVYAEANARLIAAAPDLLEALADCLETLEYVSYAQPDLVGYGVRAGRAAAARAAIAKALGEEVTA
jgi:hypothetical protein